LENGKTITINASNNTADTRYISKVSVNGKTHTANWFDHQVLMQGATIDFTMSSTPNKERGTREQDVPYSFSIKR
jgi:putative alpha-1,2-mannosidase